MLPEQNRMPFISQKQKTQIITGKLLQVDTRVELFYYGSETSIVRMAIRPDRHLAEHDGYFTMEAKLP